MYTDNLESFVLSKLDINDKSHINIMTKPKSKANQQSNLNETALSMDSRNRYDNYFHCYHCQVQWILPDPANFTYDNCPICGRSIPPFKVRDIRTRRFIMER